MSFIGPFGYTARICMTEQPDPAFWSFVEIAEVTLSPASLLTGIPRALGGHFAYLSQDAAKRAVARQLQDARRYAELDAELAADDAYLYSAPCPTTPPGVARARHCHAMRAFYNAHWRIAQIESLLLRLEAFDQPIRHRARSISVSPTRIAA